MIFSGSGILKAGVSRLVRLLDCLFDRVQAGFKLIMDSRLNFLSSCVSLLHPEMTGVTMPRVKCAFISIYKLPQDF